MIDFKDGRYVAAIWFVPLENMVDREGIRYAHGDWHAVLYKDDGEERFRAAMRFRYYVDDKVHDSGDKKSWYQVSFPGTEAEALSAFGKVVNGLAGMGRGANIHKLIIRSSDPKFIFERLMAEGWAHLRLLKDGEEG
jgi:hypothetical protein